MTGHWSDEEIDYLKREVLEYAEEISYLKRELKLQRLGYEEKLERLVTKLRWAHNHLGYCDYSGTTQEVTCDSCRLARELLPDIPDVGQSWEEDLGDDEIPDLRGDGE